MKIAFIGQKGIPALSGGIEAHVTSLSKQLAKQGADVTVYARTYYTPRVLRHYEGVKIKHTPSLYTKHLDAISHTFFSLIHAVIKKYDVIHIHGIGPALLIWIPICFSPKTKIVFTFHCKDYFHKKWNIFAKAFLRLGEFLGVHCADKVICVSQELQNYVKREYKRDAIYLPNGVNILERKKSEKILKEWGLKGNDYILCVSRLIAHKGIHYVIEAFRQLDTDKKLVIVGDGMFTDDYVKKLHELAKHDSRIIFTGKQTGTVLEELYSNAYVFVQPSENEGLSIALLEALSYGLNVLSSDIPENKEVLKNYGYLFVNKEVSDLKEKLANLLGTSLEQRSDAKKYISNSFNWEYISKMTHKTYYIA